ncbi:hypothetical protein N9W34_04585, partial [Rickettsiales bacterium]|nr:hypothetical protein [Rickettsiales bacterium]
NAANVGSDLEFRQKAYFNLGIALYNLSELESDQDKKVALLDKAAKANENAANVGSDPEFRQKAYFNLGVELQILFQLTQEQELIEKSEASLLLSAVSYKDTDSIEIILAKYNNNMKDLSNLNLEPNKILAYKMRSLFINSRSPNGNTTLTDTQLLINSYLIALGVVTPDEDYIKELSTKINEETRKVDDKGNIQEIDIFKFIDSQIRNLVAGENARTRIKTADILTIVGPMLTAIVDKLDEGPLSGLDEKAKEVFRKAKKRCINIPFPKLSESILDNIAFSNQQRRSQDKLSQEQEKEIKSLADRILGAWKKEHSEITQDVETQKRVEIEQKLSTIWPEYEISVPSIQSSFLKRILISEEERSEKEIRDFLDVTDKLLKLEPLPEIMQTQETEHSHVSTVESSRMSTTPAIGG